MQLEDDNKPYPVDVWPFKDRKYTITRGAVLLAFVWRHDTKDGLCVLCEKKSGDCKCTEAVWRSRIDMDQLPAYLENHGLLDWLREHVLNDFDEPVRYEIDLRPAKASSREVVMNTRVAVQCSPQDMEWLVLERFVKNLCVYCGLPKTCSDGRDCACTAYSWSLLDADHFILRLVRNNHSAWLAHHLSQEDSVRRNPTRKARKKA